MENIIHLLLTGPLISCSILKMFVSLFLSAIKGDVCLHTLFVPAASSRNQRANHETMSILAEGKGSHGLFQHYGLAHH